MPLTNCPDVREQHLADVGMSVIGGKADVVRGPSNFGFVPTGDICDTGQVLAKVA